MLSVFALASFTSAARVDGTTNTATFSSMYSAEWLTYDDGDNAYYLQVKLSITNLDYSGWSN